MVRILQFISRFGALQVLAKIRMSWAHNISSELTPRNQRELIVMVNHAHLMMGNAKIHSYHAKQDFKLSTAPQ